MNKEEIEKAKEYIVGLIDLFYEFPNPQSVLLEDNKVQYVETLLQYINQLEQENNKQSKIIDLMAKQLAGIAIWNIEKDEPIILKDKEEVKQYFEEKAEES